MDTVLADVSQIDSSASTPASQPQVINIVEALSDSTSCEFVPNVVSKIVATRATLIDVMQAFSWIADHGYDGVLPDRLLSSQAGRVFTILSESRTPREHSA